MPKNGSACWCETIDIGVEIKSVEEAVPTCAPNAESEPDQPTQAPQAEVVSFPAVETPSPFAIVIDTPAPTSDLPMAVDDHLATCAGVSAGKDVISNDVADKGLPLLVKHVVPETSGENGLCYVKLDRKTVEYHPHPGFAGLDHCDYLACDGLDRCKTARIRIRVNAAGEGDCPETAQPSARPTPVPTPDPTPSP